MLVGLYHVAQRHYFGTTVLREMSNVLSHGLRTLDLLGASLVIFAPNVVSHVQQRYRSVLSASNVDTMALVVLQVGYHMSSPELLRTRSAISGACPKFIFIRHKKMVTLESNGSR